MHLSKQALQEDVLQLTNLLVESHPDPYSAGGGTLAFHRRVQNILASIPEDGMTSSDFLRLLRPLVASVQDGHTSIRPSEKEGGQTVHPRPWLDWDVVEGQLYLAGVYRPEDGHFLGARLRMLEGLAFAQLIEGVSRVRGCDNEYHRLVCLGRAFAEPEFLADILGCEALPQQLHLTLQLPDGSEQTTVFPLSETAPGKVIQPATSVSMSDLNAAQLGWSFLDEQRKIACLRATSMSYYREAFEYSYAVGYQSHIHANLKKTAQEVTSDPLPEDIAARIALIPSATDLLQELFGALRAAQSTHLIIDVRHNGGGNSLFGAMLLYFLYGLERLLSTDEGYQIQRYSPLFFQANQNLKPADHQDALQNGGYDFSMEKAWQIGQHQKRSKEDLDHEYQDLRRIVARTPTFSALLEQQLWEATWTPQVLVLTSADTYSAGFDLVLALYRQGADVIGVPSAQAANCFIDGLWYQLKHSQLEGWISYKRSLGFPDDAERGKLLRPHIELSYAYLASQGFDPHATVRLALEHLKGQA
ncbi:MAG TPA: S41 family peptidase [Ktedonobacteraceae bacterium]|nr:S41 family peptidase [Ktedonobacteraceae bacterium]